MGTADLNQCAESEFIFANRCTCEEVSNKVEARQEGGVTNLNMVWDLLYEHINQPSVG